MKTTFRGLVGAAALIGLYAIGSFGVQLKTDYDNFKKIVIWVAQKQVQEAQAAQRAQQQQRAAAQAPTPTPPATSATATK